MSIISDQTRANFKAGDDIRDAGLTTPAEVLRRDDIRYGEDPRWQVLDVYRPRDARGPLPVIVSVHGGGWVYGDKERYQFYCMDLARRGFAVVNFTYRLAPEFQFPAGLEDTNSVFAWVLDNAAEYGFDAAHVFAVGDSAGAHMLGLYTAICTDPDYAAAYPFTPPAGFVPAAIGLNCGAYVIDIGAGDHTALLMADLLPGGGTPAELEQINVLRHVNPGFPPVFVMTANDDFLRTQAPALVARLTECGVPFLYRMYGDKDHRLGHVFHCDMRNPLGALCNDEQCDFFRRLANRE